MEMNSIHCLNSAFCLQERFPCPLWSPSAWNTMLLKSNPGLPFSILGS